MKLLISANHGDMRLENSKSDKLAPGSWEMAIQMFTQTLIILRNCGGKLGENLCESKEDNIRGFERKIFGL